MPVLPLPAVLLGTPVQHAPVTGTDRCDQAASAPLLSSGVRSDNERMVNRVFVEGCSTCLLSAPPARTAGASGAATELSLLQGHGVATSVVPVLQAAQKPRRVDPDRPLQLDQGVGTNPATFTLSNGPPRVLDCQQFLEALLKYKYAWQRDKSVLEHIANAVLLRGERPEIRLRHKNGRVRVYSRQLSPRKALVKVSQANKRKAAARRLVGDGCGVAARLQRGRTAPSGGPVRLSVSEQVGLVAALSMSRVGFNRWRLASGGARSRLASLPVLRAARREMYSLPGKQVIVTRSGAHLASLTAAIQERVTALCDADLFVERPVRDALDVPNEAGTAAAFVDHPGSPPSTEQDVHVTLGLDKGNDPGTVNFMASTINQAHQRSQSNTILVGVCYCDEGTYDESSAMLATHLPQIDLLLRNGVTVHGARRPLRLILGSDYAAQCSLLGQKSATDTQPCLYCKTLSGRAASRRCLTPPLAPFKTSRAGGTCESARTLSTAWRLMTYLGQAASPASPIIIARWRRFHYLGSTRAKVFQYFRTVHKVKAIHYCDLRLRS